jgi:hypothetical protein
MAVDMGDEEQDVEVAEIGVKVLFFLLGSMVPILLSYQLRFLHEIPLGCY